MIGIKSKSNPRLILLATALIFSSGIVRGEARSAPIGPIFVETASLSVVLDPSDGLPYKYLFGDGHKWGEDSGSRMTAIFADSGAGLT